jgi:hypothetical protein
MTSPKDFDGGAPSKQSFRWPCPGCRQWHRSDVAAGVQVGEPVRVRCPVTGRVVERPMVIHPDLAGASETASRGASEQRLSGIRQWLRKRVPGKPRLS